MLKFCKKVTTECTILRQIKKKKILGRGTSPPQTPPHWGGGHLLPMPHLLGAFGTSIPLAFGAWVPPLSKIL